MAEASYDQKMVLSKAAHTEVQRAHTQVVDEFLGEDRQMSNVVGLAQGVKWKNGRPTGEPALIVLVTHKIGLDELRQSELVPSMLADMQTDVLAIGYPFAGLTGTMPASRRAEMVDTNGHRRVVMEVPEAGIETLTKRSRPAQGGYSVGHINITAGTIATGVYDILPGGSTNPPTHGLGQPARYYILSNNHVLANSNNANIGDSILQPGPADGGTNPADRIASLSRFIPIRMEPGIPRAQHNNLVDAAIAETQFHDLERAVYWAGNVRGWRRKANVTVGTLIQKTGRTTSFTTGRITAIGATIDVGYGGGRVARFVDQIVTTNMSAPGDSGSLVTTLDNVAVGLLYAGSSVATILNQIENVRSLLRVEVAEQIL